MAAPVARSTPDGAGMGTSWFSVIRGSRVGSSEQGQLLPTAEVPSDYLLESWVGALMPKAENGPEDRQT